MFDSTVSIERSNDIEGFFYVCVEEDDEFNLVEEFVPFNPVHLTVLLPPGSRRRQCIPGGRRAGEDEEEGGTAVGAPQGAHPPEHDLARARRDGARHGLHRRRPQSCASAPIVVAGLLALQDAVGACVGGGASSPHAMLKRRASSSRLQGPCGGESATGVPARGVVAVTGAAAAASQ